MNLERQHEIELSKEKEHRQITCKAMEDQYQHDKRRCKEEHERVLATLKEERDVIDMAMRNENNLLKKEKAVKVHVSFSFSFFK